MSDSFVIRVGGYGAFLFHGTKQEAEEMRAHKARWEGGIGKMRDATVAEANGGAIDACWNHPMFGNKFRYADCDCGKCSAPQRPDAKDENP